MKLYPPPFHLCPIYDYVNKWDFFYPPPSQIGQCLILGNFFFLKASLSQTATFSSQVHNTKGANIHHLNPKTCVSWTWTQLYILTIIVVVTNKHISNSSAFSHCKVCVTDGILSPIQKINKHQCFCQWNSGRMRTLSPPALPRSRMGQWIDSYPLSRMSLLLTMTPALY